MTDSSDGAVVNAGDDVSDDTAPVMIRRATPARFTVGRALPPQAPPVTDVHLLDFRPPGVPSGSVARYRARTGTEVTELPEFDAEWKVRRREPRRVDTGAIVAHQNDELRVWRRRATLTVVAVSVVAVVAGVVGLLALARLG